MKKIVILGAGLAGLSAAFHIEREKNKLKNVDYEIFEKEMKAGGLCRTEVINGFSFDNSGHLLHLKNEYTRTLIERLLGDNLNLCKRDAWIYLRNRYIRYPFQANLDSLPEKVGNECLYEFYKANADNQHKRNDEFANFEDWILGRFGKGIARHFMVPFNRKLWGRDLKEISCKWVDKYIPVPRAEDIVNETGENKKKDYGYNVTFLYPKTGGIQTLPDAFEKKVKKIRLGMEVNEIDLKNKVLRFSNKEEIKYDVLISTIPLKELIRITINPPKRINNYAESLEHNSVLIINLGIKRNDSLKHWVYVPEEIYPFYRFGYFSNFSQHMAPKGESSLYCEVSYRRERKIDEEKVRNDVINGLIDIRVIKDESEIIEKKVLNIEYAYVIYNSEHEKLTKEIHEFLKQNSIFSIGRYGSWEYSSMEDAIIQGRDAVNQIAGE